MNKCPRCGGWLVLDRDGLLGAEWCCLMCGRRSSVNPTEPAPYTPQTDTYLARWMPRLAAADWALLRGEG